MPERYVFRGRKFDVKIIEARLPDGRVATKEAVVYPGAALIIPVLDDGRIVMIRQYRAVVGRWLYELPAGTLEPGEDPEECARRELEEETGYRARDIRPLFKAYTAPGYSTEVIHFYVARSLSRSSMRPDQDEVIGEVARVTLGEALGMVRDGVIVDMKTIAALLYYASFGEEALRGG